MMLGRCSVCGRWVAVTGRTADDKRGPGRLRAHSTKPRLERDGREYARSGDPVPCSGSHSIPEWTRETRET